MVTSSPFAMCDVLESDHCEFGSTRSLMLSKQTTRLSARAIYKISSVGSIRQVYDDTHSGVPRMNHARSAKSFPLRIVSTSK